MLCLLETASEIRCKTIPHICHIFYTGRIFQYQILRPKIKKNTPKNDVGPHAISKSEIISTSIELKQECQHLKCVSEPDVNAQASHNRQNHVTITAVEFYILEVGKV